MQGEVKKMKLGKGIICPNFHLAAVVVIKYRDGVDAALLLR